MTQEEIDTMWQKAMQESIKNNEMYTRYHFAKLVAEREREACAKLCDELIAPDFYSDTEISMWDVTCMDCATAIRARGEQEPVGDDIASIIACRNMLDAQPVPPKVNK